jgi:phospholipase/carboxylesterase
MHVPASYKPETPLPLVVMLHGAGGSAQGALRPLLSLADEVGLILVAPESRGRTWDAIRDDFTADPRFIDRALALAFSKCNVDPKRVIVEGFSDGATYALSLGIANGDLFARAIGFSPGFVIPAAPRGKPKIFISHGRGDQVLPIESCSRRIVPALRQSGYDVDYTEFDGGHLVPPDIARKASAWIRQ